MAGQIKDWVYKKVDWAYSTGSWEWSVNVATTTELFKYFSSTVIFRDHANVYDNRHYGLTSKYDGLMIRPITGNNGYTGVMHFHLYNENDRYYSDCEGLYGEFTLRDLVLMVFKACGLMVSEAKRTYWVNQVLSLMITLPAERSWVCNTSIRRAGGYQVAAYVDKSIVDDIIDCMRVKGMFDYTTDMPDTLPASTIELGEPEQTLEEMVTDMCNEFNNSEAFNGFKEEHTIYEGWELNPVTIYQQIVDGFADNDIDISDYKYFNVRISTSIPSAGSISTIGIAVITRDYIDDSITLTEQYTKQVNDYGWYFNITRADLERSVNYYTEPDLSTKHNCPLYSFRVAYDTVGHQSYIYGTPTFENENYSGDMVFSDVDRDYSQYSYGAYVYYVTLSRGNYGTSKIWPEGISLVEDAVPPKRNTSSSNRWSNWSGRAITVNGYSGSNHPTYTYIPVGYGDYDYEGFTQARVQSGWIYNNTWLQRLGLTMELMADYEPVEPDPDDPEPIQPDPDPTPEPTPPDPGILDISASRLFTVHQLSNAEVDNLGSFIYSQTFIDAIKNMFMEPMDAIIGCFILNYGSGGTLPLGTNETLKLGSVLGATGVTGTKVTNQTFECSFGTKEIGEFYHNVLDYAPYTSVQIYLPYIGFVDLDTNEVMNSRITLKYRFDVFTGMCLARLFVNRNGVTHELYNFEGNSAVHIPLTGRDFTNAIAPMLSGAVGLIGGAATGNPVAMAVGAHNMIGNNANVKRSGSLSSNTGVLGQQTPFILVNRPKAYNAAGYNSYYGYPSNWTVTLSSCSGYTRCKDVHLDALSCSDQEREEIEALLREGVIF